MPTDTYEFDGLQVSGIASKIVEGPDADGDVKIAVKATVHNQENEDPDVAVYVQALDADEFEVMEVRLSGHINMGEGKVLTTTEWSRDDKYRSIDGWRVQ